MPLRPVDLPDTPTEQSPHEFEIDIQCLVNINHNLTVQAIADEERRHREIREEERGRLTDEEFQEALNLDEISI